MNKLTKNYKDVTNLSEWSVIFYLSIYKTSTRKQMAEDLNVFPTRISYVIKRLKDKDIVKSKFGKHQKEVLYYLR